MQTVSAAVHEIAHSKLHNQTKIQIDNDQQYQEVELFEKPALFSNGRISHDDLPEGVYCYDPVSYTHLDVYKRQVRALRLTPEQLNAMLSGGTVPGMAAASADYNEQEDTAHEE